MALFRIARGTCYFPDCSKPIIEETEGERLIAVQIAHISGANEGSARYESTMTDADRSAFSNLVLLCTAHHKLVDGPRRDRYTRELLHEWKADNESNSDSLSTTGLTVDNLEEVLEGVLARYGPIREVVVDLEAVLWIDDARFFSAPFDDMQTVLQWNAHYRGREKGAVVTIRNTGSADVSAEDVALIYQFESSSAQVKGSEFSLKGHNDYLYKQSVPHRLLAGDAFRWLTKETTLAQCEAAADSVNKRYSTLIARVRLATGEIVESPAVPWSSVSGLLTTSPDDNESSIT